MNGAVCPVCGLDVETMTAVMEPGMEIPGEIPQITYKEMDRVKYYVLVPCGHPAAGADARVDLDGVPTWTVRPL